MVILDVQQRTPEWHLARRGIPTASEFGRIITPKTGKLSAGADGYIAELIDEIVRPDAERGFGGNRHTDRGNELEPEARDWYAFAVGLPLREAGFCLSDCGRYGCSPDALVGDDGGCEIKAPDGPKHVTYLRAGELPDEYKPQVHGSLVVTGRAWWSFVSWCPPYRPLLVRVEPDDYTASLAAALGQFCDRLAAAKAEFLEAA